MLNSHGRNVESVVDDFGSDFCSQWNPIQDFVGESIDRLGESVLFSGDGSVLAIAGGGLLSVNSRGFVRLYEVPNDREIRQLGNQIEGRNEFDNRPRSIDLSFDGRMVAFGERSSFSSKGRVRVFRYSDADSDWLQLGQDLEEGDQFSDFGEALSLSDDGSTLAVGASGVEQIFVYQLHDNDATWTQVGTITTPSDGDSLGSTVSLSGDGTILAAGDPFSNVGDRNNMRGRIHLYGFDNISGWTEWGDAITGEKDFENIGQWILLASDGRTMAVSLTRDSTATSSASARVYRLDLNDSQWKRLGNDIAGEIASGTTNRAGIALSLSVDGRSIAVGSPGGSGSARVYRYQRSVDEWLLVGDETVGGSPGNQYGSSIALSVADSRAYLAVGARFRDRFLPEDNAGIVRVFEVSSTCFHERLDLERKESAIDQLGIRLIGVERGLDQSAISDFEEISMDSFDTYFDTNIPTVQGMVSRFSVIDHDIDMANVTIEFSIRMVYVEASDSNFTATDLVYLPFNDSGFTAEYWRALSQVDAFGGLQQPIEAPFQVDRNETAPRIILQGKRLIPTGLISGVVVGAVIVALTVVLVAYRRFKRNLPEGIVVNEDDANPNNHMGDAVPALDAELVDDSNEREEEPRGLSDQRRVVVRSPGSPDGEPFDAERKYAALRGPDYKDQIRPSHRGTAADRKIIREKLVNPSDRTTTIDLPLSDSTPDGSVGVGMVERPQDQPLIHKPASGPLKGNLRSSGLSEAYTKPAETVDATLHEVKDGQDSQARSLPSPTTTSFRASRATHDKERGSGNRRKPDP